MYLAPLNYDRYFKKVFSDERIAKKFLEDFLDVSITSLERLPQQHQITDEAAIVEFDFRCQIEDAYVIIDMQQWYKPDIVQRFYLYHALNSGLQLEQLPKERFIIDHVTRKLKKVKDYRALEPVLTLIWLVDGVPPVRGTHTLRFEENYVAYTMTPELVLEFIKSERLWYNPEIRELLKERERVLAIALNRTKDLDFLTQNRLIFLLQKNIVQHLAGAPYERWFQFAEKSRNRENESRDFDEFRGDEIFEEMMRRLNQGELTEEDVEYIENEQEMWEEVARLEQGYYERGHREGWLDGRDAGFAEGRNEGRKEGRKEGQNEGRKENAIENARIMLADGLDLETVAKYTRLSLADVTALIDED